MADNKTTIKIDVEGNASKEIKRLAKGFKDFEKTSGTSLLNFKNIAQTSLGFVGGAAIVGAFKGFASAANGAIESVVQKAAEIETIKTQFETLTGSVASADKILKDLQQFAATTPFQLPGIAKAAKGLLAFGFEQEQIIDKLQVLGDVAAASGASLQEIGLIFGQVSAAGKLTGERLLQLQERAIPIGPALAKTMGVAESAVRKLVSQGKVDFKIFETAFQSLAKEGNFAFQGMVKQSKTLAGVFSTLGDNVDLVQAELGSILLPTIKLVATEVIKFIQANKGLIESLKTVENQEAIKEVFLGIAESMAITITVLDAFGRLAKFTFNLVTAAARTMALGVLAPLALIEEGMRAIARSIPGFADEFGEGTSKISSLVSELANDIVEDVQDMEDAFTADTFLGDAAVKAGEFSNALTNSFGQVTEAVDKTTESAKKNKQAMIELTAEQQKLGEEGEKLSAKLLLQNQTEQEKFQERSAALRAARAQDKITEAEFETALNLAAEERDIKDEGSLLKKREDLVAHNADLAVIDDERSRAQIEINKNTIKQIDNDENISQKSKDKRRAKDIKDEEKKNALLLQGTSQFFGNLASLQNTNSKELFIVGQIAAIAQAIVNTAQAITLNLATFPGPVGIAFAAAAGIAGAVQIAAIKDQKFQKAQDGITEVPPGFPNDSFGPVALTTGERVVDAGTNSDLKQFLAGDSMMIQLLASIDARLGSASAPIVNVSIGEREIIEAVRDGLEDGRILAV